MFRILDSYLKNQESNVYMALKKMEDQLEDFLP